MRKLIPFLLAACPVLMAEPVTQHDRDRLIEHLERTRKIFLTAISGVNQQWVFKAAPDRWSIAECAEHIVATEAALLEMVRDKVMKAPPPAGDPGPRVTDEGVLAFITDRSQKAKAPEVLQPKSRYAAKAEVEAAFGKARGISIEYVRTTQDDLRGRYNKTARGAMDAYQYLLMMAGHSERHSMQIEEVKTSAGYPR